MEEGGSGLQGIQRVVKTTLSLDCCRDKTRRGVKETRREQQNVFGTEVSRLCITINGTLRGIHQFFPSNVARNSIIHESREQHGKLHVFKVRFVHHVQEQPRLVRTVCAA